MGSLAINGVNTGIQHVRELQDGVTLEQIQKTIDGDGLDSVVFEKDGKAYMAWGDHLDFSGIENLKQGDAINASLNGKAINLILFENEVNSATEGLSQAWELGKKAVVGGGKLFVGEGIKVVGAGITLGWMAKLGGAKVAEAAGSGLLSKTGAFLFGPAKGLTGDAMKGFAKMGKWAAIIGAGVAVAGTAGLAIYGGNRSQDATGMLSITKNPN